MRAVHASAHCEAGIAGEAAVRQRAGAGLADTRGARITDILNEKRAVTTETAMRLGRTFGQSPRFWINLQSNTNLALAEAEMGKRLDAEVMRAGFGCGTSSGNAEGFVSVTIISPHLASAPARAPDGECASAHST